MPEKGTIWRKWDLHIHTPYSKIHQYSNANWDTYFLKLAQITKEKNISVIGINDYWILEGYYKVREAWEKKQKFTDPDNNEEYNLSHIEAIFPVVEYRTDQYVGENQKLNIHYLFDPTLSIDKLKEVVTKLYNS